MENSLITGKLHHTHTLEMVCHCFGWNKDVSLSLTGVRRRAHRSLETGEGIRITQRRSQR